MKINADLALYWARVKSFEAYKCGVVCCSFTAQPPLTRLPLSRATGATRRQLNAAVRELYAKALSYNPSDGRAYLGLARLLEKEGRVDEAREMYDQGTRATGGDNPFLWQAWAVLEERQGQVAPARRLYDAATVADKRHAAAWHAWGMLEKRQGNYQKARDLFVQGLRLVGDRPGVEFLHQSLGCMAAERGRADEARAHFAAGARTGTGKKSPALWHAWGRLEQSQGQTQRARLLFQRALRASPRNNHTWLAWAQLEAQAGCVARARELFRQGAALNPSDVVLLQGWACFEAAMGRLAVARALFERSVEADPGHQAAWQAWGCAEAAAGHAATARQLFQRGVWVNPTTSGALTCFQAWACLEAKEDAPGLARQLFRAALRIDPASVPAWHGWAQLEERLGNDAKAAELRALCLQQRAEEAVGLSDTPAVDPSQLLRPFLNTVTGWFTPAVGGVEGAASSQQAQLSDDLLFMRADPAQPQGAAPSAMSDDVAAPAGETGARQTSRLGADEGVLGISGLLRDEDAATADAAAQELDAVLRQARLNATLGDGEVAERVRQLISTLGGTGQPPPPLPAAP
jgi:tetratricopeptide (TPR) repeat protein